MGIIKKEKKLKDCYNTRKKTQLTMKLIEEAAEVGRAPGVPGLRRLIVYTYTHVYIYIYIYRERERCFAFVVTAIIICSIVAIVIIITIIMIITIMIMIIVGGWDAAGSQEGTEVCGGTRIKRRSSKETNM